MTKCHERENLLDYVPMRKQEIYCRSDNESVILKKTKQGVFSWFAKHIFHTENYNEFVLEKYGSFLWYGMDGKKSVYDLGMEFQQQFGDETEPLWERLVMYLKILYKNGLIDWKR